MSTEQNKYAESDCVCTVEVTEKIRHDFDVEDSKLSISLLSLERGGYYQK